VAVYTAYSDESGSGDGKGIFLVGGYVASAIDWPCVVDAWQERVLDYPPSIKYFHLSEINKEKFQKKYGLRAGDSDRKLRTAVDVVCSSGGLQGIYAPLDQEAINTALAEYRAIFSKRAGYSVRDPDYVCFLTYAFNVLDEARNTFKDIETVDFVVERKGKITEHIQHFYEEFCSFLSAIDPSLKSLAGRLIPEDTIGSPGLQAADLLCGIVRRTMEGRPPSVEHRRLANSARPLRRSRTYNGIGYATKA
jgi:hypothetical protein